MNSEDSEAILKLNFLFTHLIYGIEEIKKNLCVWYDFLLLSLMARAKLFAGFLFFLTGCALAIFLFAMLLDDGIVYSETVKIWFGVISVFSTLTGLLILTKSNL